jgi:hypothetical protein
VSWSHRGDLGCGERIAKVITKIDWIGVGLWWYSQTMILPLGLCGNIGPWSISDLESFLEDTADSLSEDLRFFL